jgi:hypothetical protein
MSIIEANVFVWQHRQRPQIKFHGIRLAVILQQSRSMFRGGVVLPIGPLLCPEEPPEQDGLPVLAQ